MAGQRLNAMEAWESGFEALERLSPPRDLMTTQQRLDCAALYFCLQRGQDLEEREQKARERAEWRSHDD